jgi:hypothetical protein
MRLVWICVTMLGIGFGAPALATPAPPEVSEAVATIKVGALCQPQADGIVAAPDTELGYITLTKDMPAITVETQVVPDALGLAFGVMVVPARDIAQVRMVAYRPNHPEPEMFYSAFVAGKERVQFFSFEFPQEQEPGLWRMEAWDGESLLYRVEFEVVAEEALPDMVARCRAMS